MNSGTYKGLVNTPGRRLVLFYGTACGPCTRLKPRLQSVAMLAGLALHEINVATELEAARGLGIRGVPSVVAIDEGRELVLFTGELQDDEILKILEREGLVR